MALKTAIQSNGNQTLKSSSKFLPDWGMVDIHIDVKVIFSSIVRLEWE